MNTHKNNCKFRLLLLAFILLASHSSKALVSNYSFAYSIGTYAPITGTTLYSGAWDDASSVLIPLPFTFTYNNTAYTNLSVNTNGFITLGLASSATLYCGLQTSPICSIAGYGTDLVNSGGSSNIKYATLGSSPNRQFVIQWTNCKHYGGSSLDSWNFQIILNESNNSVQVVWGGSTDATNMGANNCADITNESGSVGLKGASVSDFNVRKVTNGTNTWPTSVTGTLISNVCNMSSSNIPPSGLTFTWTPPVVSGMTYVSSTTSYLNNNIGLSRGSVNNKILGLLVVTSGNTSPLNITSLTLSTSGCTNAATDISNVKVFFTGTNPNFATTTQFGSLLNPNGSFIVNGTAILSEGTNFFWVTYDISNTASFEDTLKACCTSFTGTGSIGSKTPTISCPSGIQIISNIGTWTPVTALAPHPNMGVMLLLSDGSVICHSNEGGGYGKGYDKLTPDEYGSYANGTWSSIASMYNDRLFFSSQMMKDGRVYVAGGEDGSGLTHGEVYDPVNNSWTLTPDPGATISDANSEILPDGRILQALVAVNLKLTMIYNPVDNTFISGPTCLGIHNESAWVKLPDNSVLFVDRLSTNSERYIPALNTWVADATVPVNLYDVYADETGSALLLPDGRAFFTGSTGTTAFYTPSGNTSPGVWTAGPTLPNSLGAPDASAAMMVNGKVLLALSYSPTSAMNVFDPPTFFYEFDYLTNIFTPINAPNGAASLNIACFQTTMLDLPDGTVLYAQNQDAASSQYYIYKPAGVITISGKPSIANITQIDCNRFRITGTQFNGISQGATYGDDWQMSTNYPIIRLTESNGKVYYCRSYNWNSTGVKRGSMPDTAYFTLPVGLAAGTYSLMVTANGIGSDPVIFSTIPSLSSSLTAAPICNASTFTYSPSSLTSNATFTWTRAAVAGISNAAITTAQISNPNETLINITASPISVVYTYTITAGSCSNTQSVSVVVNPSPLTTCPGNMNLCSTALPFTLTGASPTGGVYTGSGVSGGIFYPANAGPGNHTILYSYTDSNGCVGNCTFVISVKDSITFSNSSVSAKGCYTWPLNGNSYSLSGVYTITSTNAASCLHTDSLHLTIIPMVLLSAKVFLDGPYIGNGLMHDSLRVLGIIPLKEPYSLSPYNRPQIGETGGETIMAAALSDQGENSIVDWVYLELRDSINFSNLLASKRALLQRDGDIVSNSDGVSPVQFLNTPAGSYYICIKHRNHLGVMSAAAVSLNQCTSTFFDFSNSDPVYVNAVLSNVPRKNVGSMNTLWPGDANNNKNVKYLGSSNDKDQVLSAVGFVNNTVYGYRVEDVNMDGKVRYNGTDNDRVVILNTIGVNSPNNILYQHTPN